ncbi:unnamed protein product [Kuraishia capsulata CBS 1993]|uniref:serine C-palmitoyltransferase n=1 Tax=Kuraishia capsulata CBS 1993 TaxID=1382522 RepID=W6MTJ6_9ASCO|nr:uncharacterized protein KUCA_T00006054001 [Kuraishia capsulata CBS 1993]CDK30059.1 unnamed protein product [Kuraishia capsulata CBS 1993]
MSDSHRVTSIAVPEFVTVIIAKVVSEFHSSITLIQRLPGGSLIIRYIRSSYKNDPIRSLFELALALLALYYFFSSRYSQSEQEMIKLSNRDVDELVDDWIPEPLVPPIGDNERWQVDSIPVTKGGISGRITLLTPQGTELKNVMNLSSRDYLSMSTNKLVAENCKAVINNSGVGACGPPNFYGTQDVHVRFQEDIAGFLGAEEGIIYGQDFATHSSVLPAFLKRGDIAVVDGGVSVALQKAVLISRCSIEWYNHNDMDHLEQVLDSLKEELSEGPITRRFIVTEGLFDNFGDSPDLAKIVELKNKYKFRLCLDETNSIGVLGPNGRGLPEQYGIPRSMIDVTIGSMALALGSSGGFCVGCTAMIQHQVLSSNAYVFSAALPPYCAKAASTVLKLLEQDPKPLTKLQSNCQYVHDLFSKTRELSKFVTVVSKPYSPALHLRISPAIREALELPESYGGPGSKIAKAVKQGKEEDYFDELYNRESYLLQKIIDSVLEHGILISRSKRILHHEILPIVPELIVSITNEFSKDELKKAFAVINKAIIGHLKDLNLDEFDSLI